MFVSKQLIVHHIDLQNHHSDTAQPSLLFTALYHSAVIISFCNTVILLFKFEIGFPNQDQKATHRKNKKTIIRATNIFLPHKKIVIK